MQPTPAYPTRIDFEDFYAWALAEDGKKPSTVKKYRSSVRHMTRAGVAWARFVRSPDDARAAVRPFLAEKVRAGPCARRRYQQMLNRLAAYLATRDARFSTLAWDVDADASHPLDPYAPHELAAVRSYSHPNPIVRARRRAMFYLHENAILRPGEAITLRAEDFCPVRRAFRLRVAEKGNNVGWVNLPDAALAEGPLAAWLAMRASLVGPAGPLWVCNDGSPMTHAGYVAELYEARAELAVPINFNRFRHSRLTLFDDLHVPFRVAQKEARHVREKSTAYYMHGSGPDKRRAALAAAGVPGYARSETARAM